MTLQHRIASAALFAIVPVACGASDGTKADGQLQQEIVSSMHLLVVVEIQGLNLAARDLQSAAPVLASGWDGSTDTGALAMATMKEAWTRTRFYWERAEGTLAPLFPDLDGSMDSRYEDGLQTLGAAGDPDPFDQQGLTGMHALERILFAPNPASVVAYESTLPAYGVAAPPATDQEAVEFKNGLCQRLVDDSQLLLDRWAPLPIALATVFAGLTGQMSAQAEKVSLGATHQEESRYSQTTMADLRSNLAGTRAIYDLFGPWLATKPYGATLNNDARQAFDRLDGIYGAVAGDALPAPPSTWGATPPSLADLQSPFGMLYQGVVQEVDPTRAGSAVDAMNQVARALGLPELKGQS